MTPLALTFMILSWAFVLGLTTWCFARVLRSEKRGRPEPPDEPGRDPRGDPGRGGLP